MSSKVVLISGKQGSGKSTLAENLTQKFIALGYMPIKAKFAAPLYEMHNRVRDVLRVSGADNLEGIDGPLLQLLGTEWGRRTRGEDIWVNCARGNVAHVEEKLGRENNLVFIFDDCRFPNELSAFDGAIKVRLEADEDIRKQRAEKWRSETGHPSEVALDNALFDMWISTSVTPKDEVAEKVLALCLERWKGQAL